MQTVNIQIKGVEKSVKDRIEAKVKEIGFSSIQDYFRVLLKRIDKTNTDPDVLLETVYEDMSLSRAEYYLKLSKDLNNDITEGKVKGYTDIDKMFDDLEKDETNI